MERRYKPGNKIDINLDNEILQVEVIGVFTGLKERIYSVKTLEGTIILVKQSDILERTDV